MATTASEFTAWLDTVCTDTSLWRFEMLAENDTLADKKYRKQQKYIHRYMMDKEWYAKSIEYYQSIMLLNEDELNLDDGTKEYGAEGFWEQFNGKP